MRCEEVRRTLEALTSRSEMREWGEEIRAHVAGCPACARHVRAQAELSSALRNASANDHTNAAPLSAVRSLVEERAAQLSSEHSWSPIMSRIAHSVARPVYMIPSALLVIAVLALTLAPWQINEPGGYHVAFAGVDKGLALQEYGVQRVLTQLGISGANVKVGDCDQACNLTITDLKSEDDVGKVVSAMYKLGDCELVEVVREDDISVNLASQKQISFDKDGTIRCEFTNGLSDEDLDKIDVVVRQIQLCCDSLSWTSEEGYQIDLVSKDCGPGTGMFKSADQESVMVVLRLGECGELKAEDCSKISIGKLQTVPESDPVSKVTTSNGLISGFELNQNYPNPFNASTTITFSAPEGGGQAKLEVYNIRGQLVKTLLDETVGGGLHQFTWDATNSDGKPVASGIYLYRLTTGDFVDTRKMSLLK